MLNEEQIERLKQDTFVAEVEAFPEIASTNDHAVERSREGDATLPLLVIAERQTSGRGRGANTWWSSSGGLTFSLLFSQKHLSTPDQAAPLTSLAIGVAVCDAVKAINSGLNVGLKWPNDVFVAGKKIAGILIECPSASVGDVVVGIGLNVNNSVREAPDDIANRATSLADLMQIEHDSFTFLLQVLHAIEYQLTQMRSDPMRIIGRCNELCVLTGRAVALEIGDRKVTGLCQGIAESGALRIQRGVETIECLAGHVDVIDAIH